jgi:hypothetical protein
MPPRVPCSFSAQQTFLDMIDSRAEQLGMKRSEYIVHALRRDIQNGGSFNIVAEQSGDYNTINQHLSPSPSVPHRRGAQTAKAGKPNPKKAKAKKK